MATFEETIEKAVQAAVNRALLEASRSSAIYGKSTTVQPPAYALIAWRRTA